MDTTDKLTKKIVIEGIIETVTGLHIGGSDTGMEIGGADSTVVRNPMNNQPYIPGSSIKGKMRSSIEKLFGAYEKVNMSNITIGPYQGKDGDEDKQIICELFGTAVGGSEDAENIPSRLLVRDAALTEQSVAKLFESDHTDKLYTEVKTEVAIDRITASANPRQIERVPAGTTFNFQLILNVFENDDEQQLLDYVKMGLLLIEDDYLGGSGSRGSGQVHFSREDLTAEVKTMDVYLENSEPEQINFELPS